MDWDYSKLKRSTLKDLLESRGHTGSNKTKKTLITELMADDRASQASDAPQSSELEREVQWRLKLYGSTPPPEVVSQILHDASQLRMMELQLSQGGSPVRDAAPVPVPTPRRLPFEAFKSFNEAEQGIDSYLHLFERQCALHQVDETDWVLLLVGRLTGRAAEAYQAMPEPDCMDYARVKERLLLRYAITPEAHRLKLRSARRKEGQPFAEWAHQLTRAAENWWSGSQVSTLEQALQLVVLEQFYDHCPQAVRDWVRDRRPLTVDQAAVLADQYMDSRRSNPSEPRPPSRPSQPTAGSARPHQGPSGSARGQPASGNRHPGSGRRCFGCNQLGHLRAECPLERPRSGHQTRRFPGPTSRPAAHHLELEGGPREDDGPLEVFTVLHEANPLQAASDDNRRHHQQTVWVDGRPARGLRDTGATITLLSPSLARPDNRTGRNIAVRVAGGSIIRVPTARVHLDWGSNARTVEVGLMGQLPSEILLGNDLGGLTSSFSPLPALEAMPVTTRQQARRQEARIQELPEVSTRPDAPLHPPFSSPDISPPDRPPVPSSDPNPDLPILTPVTPYPVEWAAPEQFAADLLTDPTLAPYRDRANASIGGAEGDQFEWDRGLLYRVSSRKGTPQRQLVVPQSYRPELLRLAHDIPLAGHMGVTKTRHRVTQKFFWPGVHPDVRRYCRSCDVCQRVGKRGDRARAPLHPLPIIEEPFSRVAVDLVGPLPRPSPSGKKYILTVVDYATRYPEAVPLTNIHAETVADALLQVFSRVGFPREILSDQGTQFMAQVTQQLWQLCQVQSLRSSPYHPQTNGLCERFNGTLKQLLRTFTLTHKDWEKYLPHLLFAYREVPQESTGFSPFELLYGRRVRGPLDLLRDHWEGLPENEGETVIGYVLAFRDRLKALTEAVRANLHAAQTRQRVWYDRTARRRVLQAGDKVLALKPTKQDRLQAAWHGPYKVVRQLYDTTYLVAKCSDERILRTFHVNMLKAYHERPEEVAAICAPATDDPEDLALPDLPGQGGEPHGVEAIQFDAQLTPAQQEQVQTVLGPRQEMFSSIPGFATGTVHRVETPGHPPLRQVAYRVPEAVREGMRAELSEMLDMGIIEPSNSPWASPVVLVPKKDGTTRFCVDYRKLNDLTTTDAYPMPRIDDLLDRIARGRYLTTLDLCKGYWQIPLDEESIPKSAFITPFGLYQSRVMPFGMKNAPATFQRMIDRLLDGLQDYACAYLDDIAVFSDSWEDHLVHLGVVLDRIRGAGLTLKPEKCSIGLSEVQYLGHRVGCGRQRPEPAKVEAIAQWPTPRTKTQVLAFLGTAGYYRRFVPDYSAIAKPLTDLTKKNLPRQVAWSPECESAFCRLKAALTAEPVLAAPDPSKRFLVHTDASTFGLGAVLSQVGEDGREHPVAYISRKLLPREVAYAAVEKECLALVWALKKLQPYLYGRSFTVLTDHNPLVWLNRVSGDNGRLLRWSLALQPFNFSIQYRPGKENGNADGLSRQTELEAAPSTRTFPSRSDGI